MDLQFGLNFPLAVNVLVFPALAFLWMLASNADVTTDDQRDDDL